MYHAISPEDFENAVSDPSFVGADYILLISNHHKLAGFTHGINHTDLRDNMLVTSLLYPYPHQLNLVRHENNWEVSSVGRFKSSDFHSC
jgi:hypothetical protein